MKKLTKSQLTVAYSRYARKYGWSISSVRTTTRLSHAAVAEWRASQ